MTSTAGGAAATMGSPRSELKLRRTSELRTIPQYEGPPRPAKQLARKRQSRNSNSNAKVDESYVACRLPMTTPMTWADIVYCCCCCCC